MKPIHFDEIKKVQSNNRPSPIYIPEILKDWNEIETLYISEIPFSAKEAIKKGLPFIGLRGLRNPKDSIWKNFDVSLIQLIKKKRIKTIVLLYNSDILEIEKPRAEKDYYFQLYKPFDAISKFKEIISNEFPDINIYFCHLERELRHKGILTIDDLFLREHSFEDPEKHIKDFRMDENSLLFSFNISDKALNQLKKHFSLDSVNSFYENYADLIQENEFIYQQVRYEYSEMGLNRVKYEDADMYLRVGTDYYKKIMIKNIRDEYEEILELWNIGTISHDYSDKKGVINDIEKYDYFANLPDNTESYEKIIEVNNRGIKSRLYNRYRKISHEIKPGSWPNIEKFLRHIFNTTNDRGENMYEFGLDYLQLTYLKPAQRLPVICLVSKERNTGKSTFLDFERLLFQENVSILDNERFTAQWTSHFIDKLVVGIDEGFIPIDKQLVKERIKNLSIGKKQWLESKGKHPKEIDCFVHLILCSNYEHNFMQIDEGENRFAVIKVNPLEKDDPGLLEKMKKEVPHFLHYLQNRKLKYPEGQSRFSFPVDVYLTDAMKKVIDKTRSALEREIREFMREAFLKFGKKELKYAAVDLAEELNRNTSFKFNKSKISDFLKDEIGMNPANKVERYTIYYYKDDYVSTDMDSNSEKTKSELSEKTKTGTPFTFIYIDWLTSEEIEANPDAFLQEPNEINF